MKPHAGQPTLTAGQPLGKGTAAMILVHGRNAGPQNILDLASHLAHPAFTYLAPAAAGNTWYPNSFMADIESNEPGISSGLAMLANLVDRITEVGVPHDHIILGGFSQGACLASEFAVRSVRRYGAVLAFSGGLIGPPGTKWNYDGDFDRTPAFFGCSDVDGHIPKSRVDESVEVFERMGATVEKRLYAGMGHTINEDELEFARTLVDAVGRA